MNKTSRTKIKNLSAMLAADGWETSLSATQMTATKYGSNRDNWDTTMSALCRLMGLTYSAVNDNELGGLYAVITEE